MSFLRAKTGVAAPGPIDVPVTPPFRVAQEPRKKHILKSLVVDVRVEPILIVVQHRVRRAFKKPATTGIVMALI